MGDSIAQQLEREPRAVNAGNMDTFARSALHRQLPLKLKAALNRTTPGVKMYGYFTLRA